MLRALRNSLRGRQPAGGVGHGQFAGQVIPQALSESIVRDQLDTMTGDPGIRLGGGRGGRKYRGGGLTLHTFASAQGSPASDAVLDALPLQRNQRRSVGGFRGTPFSPGFNDTPPAGD